MADTKGYGRNLYALMLAATTAVLSWTIIQPVFSLYIAERGASVIQIGLLYSLISFVPLVIRIPMSVVAERVGRIRMLIIGLGVTAIASFLYAYAQSFTQVVLITLFNSLSTGSFNQTAMSTVSDAAPAQKQGDVMGRYLTFLGIGMMVGPMLCSFLIETLSYRQLLLLSTLFPILGVLLLVNMPPQVPRRVVNQDGKPQLGTVESLRIIMKNRNVMLLSYCRASFASSQAILLALFSIYAVQQLGINESTVALLFTIRGFSNMLTRFPAGVISDRIGRRTPMLIAYGLLTVSFTLIALSGNVIVLGLALALYGVCWGTRAVSEWSLLTDLVEPEIKTISISYLSSVFGFGSTLGSLAAGLLTTIFPYSTIFLLGAALNLGAIPAILAMKKPEP
ncbi:MAG: MFS transporter [Candidatus Bathyarchaeota archaeon]|nr:MFS transporter [Candidatus Bathyarchaeota archaeon]